MLKPAMLPRTLISRALRAFSFVLGVCYWVALPAYPYTASPVVKGLSIAALGVLPWISRQGLDRPGAGLLSGALFASAVGDVLLDIDPERLFVPGLCAFLAAHLVYTALFARNGGRFRNVGLYRGVSLAGVWIYVVLFWLWLMPSLGPLKIAVTTYICAITAMATTALFSRFNARVAAGALLFVISDSLIAVAKFKTPVPARGYLVWATYFAAQYLIATGALGGKVPAPIE